MIWQTQQDIRWLQIEITSLCQAGCIDCNRWRESNGKWLSNGYHNHFNKYYDTDKFRSHINQFTNLSGVSICGNVGDPMAHPQIAKIVEHIWETNDCDIDISTNGAIGTIEQYKQLAKFTPREFSVSFAIDGLEDTNHIYRRGVVWKDLMKKVNTFIQAGGRAIWVWIDFPHTRHQLEQAKEMSRSLGFDSFEIRQRFTQTKKFDDQIIEASKQPVLRNEFMTDQPVPLDELEVQHREQMQEFLNANYYIDAACTHKSDNKFHHPCPHLNVDGTLWPCCYTANGNYHKNLAIRQWWIDKDKQYGEGWNNLHSHSVNEILQSDFFTNDLQQSWNQDNLICYQNCGKCKD